MREKTMRCPLCGSADITPRTKITVSGNREALVSFLLKGQREVFDKTIGITVGRASLCLDCGHLMWACAEKELEKLRAQKANLIAS
jgi:hypothetical protein